MARYKYTAGERAVAVIGAMAGKSLDEINAQLRADRGRDGGELKELNEESYKMLLRRYAPSIDPTLNQGIWDIAWRHITAPKAMGDL